MPRLNLPQLEEEVQKYWEKEDVFRKVVAAGKGKKKFYFLQGPPFTSGKAHIGHAWNHALKDLMIRYKSMQGYDVLRRAGWDTHGLPIEVKVEEKLKTKNKKDIEDFGVENFIKECKKFAIENMNAMTSQLKRLGAWLDWDDPYLTLNKTYMESVWFGIKRAYEKKLLYEDKQVIHWCPRCETAVAGYEVKDEYKEVEDYSVYVKVQLKDKKEKLLIWTTTPWTLPANVSIALHPEFNYVKVKYRGEILILVKEKLQEALGDSSEYEILEEVKGKKLDGLGYLSILDISLQKGVEHKLVMAPDLVNLEEGTGAVHMAPGHGEEDFEVGKKYKLEVLSPVDETGKLTCEPYKGVYIYDANSRIIEDLKKSQVLLREEKISHRYPHCWRCKSPLLLRATQQWFLRISALREHLIKKNKEIDWIPDWIGSGRFENWLMNARDWCISRQRYWNTPLPIWRCSCGEIEVIGSLDELEKKVVGKVDVEKLELHRPQIDEVKLKCGECGQEMSRVKDVLDVWIDSGSASWANLNYPNNKELFKEVFPPDFITEGSDQTRGWFYSLLVTSLISFDEIAYKQVLYHGFTLDAEGRKMSKSLGNVIGPDEMIKKYGADTLRFYTLFATAPWEDLRFSIEGITSIERMFNIFWNSYEFARRYMELDKFSFSPKEKVDYQVEDLWLLSRFNSLIKNVTSGMEKVYPHEVTREINNFIVLELSRWYIKLIRERVWLEKTNESKLAAYHTLHEVFEGVVKLLAPISPHLSEYLYRDLTQEKSVHLQNWPKFDESRINKELEEQMLIAQEIAESVKASREKAKIKLRWPIPKVTLSLKEGVKIDKVKEIILKACNAKELEFKSMEEELMVKPNFSVIGPKFKKDAGEVRKLLEKSDAGEIKKELEKEGGVVIGKFSLSKDDLVFEKKLPEGVAREEFNHGVTYIDSHLSKELYSEAMAREVIRRIQEMRKELKLNELEKVRVFILCSGKFKPLVEENKEFIAHETRAEISFGQGEGHRKEWQIEEEKVTIALKK